MPAGSRRTPLILPVRRIWRRGGRLATLLVLVCGFPAGAVAQGTVIVRRFPNQLTDPWTLSFSVGRPIGGPTGQMKDRLLAEGWTEHYCDVSKTICHDNPLINGPPISITASLSRRLTQGLSAGATLSHASLGSAKGRHSGVDVTADWSTTVMGTSLIVNPVRLVRIGVGPMLGFLNSQTTDGRPRIVVRTGASFEAGVRTSSSRSMFVDFSVSYRLLGRRTEGPWPGIHRGFSAPAGPSSFEANFSHFLVAFGVGWRLSS